MPTGRAEAADPNRQAGPDAADPRQPLRVRGAKLERASLQLGLGPQLTILLGLTLALRLPWLDALPQADELYRLLAAQGVVEHGEPRIADGFYRHAHLFTILLAWVIEPLSGSLVVARLPSLVFGSAQVLVVFLWTRSLAGGRAAWTAALLLAWSTQAIERSVTICPDALMTLALLLMGWTAWCAVSERVSLAPRLVLAILATAAAALAVRLHALSLITIGAVTTWLLVDRLPAWRTGFAAAGTRRRLLLLGVMALGAAAGATLVLAPGALDLAARGPSSGAGTQEPSLFFHRHLLAAYPLLWPLTGFAAIAALGWRPRAAGFMIVVAGVSLIALSLSGVHSDRHLDPLLPFLFVLWGLAVAACWRPVGRLARALMVGAGRALQARPARRLGAWPMLAPGLALAAFGIGEPVRTAEALMARQLPPVSGRQVVAAGWPRARAALAPWLERARTVVTTDAPSALHYLGRADLLLSHARLLEIGEIEFARDPRTGLAVISTARSLQGVIDCLGPGLLITSTYDLAAAGAVPVATARLLRGAAEPLELPGLPELHVFWWDGPADAACRNPVPDGTVERAERGPGDVAG